MGCKPSQLIPITPGHPGEPRLAQDCRLLISPLYCHLVINTALLLRATASRGHRGQGHVSMLLGASQCNVIRVTLEPTSNTGVKATDRRTAANRTVDAGDPWAVSRVIGLGSRSIMDKVTTASVTRSGRVAAHCLVSAAREFVFTGICGFFFLGIQSNYIHWLM